MYVYVKNRTLPLFQQAKYKCKQYNQGLFFSSVFIDIPRDCNLLLLRLSKSSSVVGFVNPQNYTRILTLCKKSSCMVSLFIRNSTRRIPASIFWYKPIMTFNPKSSMYHKANLIT